MEKVSTKTRQELRAYAAKLEFRERQRLIGHLSPLEVLSSGLIKNLQLGVYDEKFSDSLQMKKFLFQYIDIFKREVDAIERQMKVWYFSEACKRLIEKGGDR